MKGVICLALAVMLAGIVGGCEAPHSDSKYAQGYVPADHGFYSHKVYHSQDAYYRGYRGIDGG
jgi:hypothetical protein